MTAETALLAAEEFAPDRDELLVEFVGGQGRVLGHDVGAVVVAPGPVEDPSLAFQAVPVNRSGVGGEEEELRGPDTGFGAQGQDAFGDGVIVPVAAEGKGPEEANLPILETTD